MFWTNQIIALEAAAKDLACPVEYTEFVASSRSPPRPPAFIFGDFPAHLAPELFSEFEIPAAGCYEIRDAQVTYDAIILLHGHPVWTLALNHPDYYVSEVLERNFSNASALEVRHVPGSAAIIHGPGYNVFGHWLLDFLPRLYLLDLAGYDLHTTKLILPSQTERFALDLLQQIGIPSENLILYDDRTQLVRPDVLIVPTILRLRSRFNPLLSVASRFWTEKLLAGARSVANQIQNKRLFIARGPESSSRHFPTRDAILSRAADAGYEIVYPERLPFSEQIQLFRSASQVIGEYGSALHGTIHAPVGTTICALRGTSYHPGFAQSGLGECLGHRTGYVFGNTPPFAVDQVVEIDNGAFSRALAAMDMWGGR